MLNLEKELKQLCQDTQKALMITTRLQSDQPHYMTLYVSHNALRLVIAEPAKSDDILYDVTNGEILLNGTSKPASYKTEIRAQIHILSGMIKSGKAKIYDIS